MNGSVPFTLDFFNALVLLLTPGFIAKSPSQELAFVRLEWSSKAGCSANKIIKQLAGVQVEDEK